MKKHIIRNTKQIKISLAGGKKVTPIIIDKAKGIVTKRVNNNGLDWLNNHFDYYKLYQEYNPDALKLYDRVGTDGYSMEYIPNIGTLADWLAERNLRDESLTTDIKDKLLKVLVDQFEIGTEQFSTAIPDQKDTTNLWIYNDLQLSNVLVTPNEEFKLIDIDSWYVKTVHPDEVWRKKAICHTRINEVMVTMTSIFKRENLNP